MIRPVLTMVRKELTQVVRDRTLLRLVVLVPIIQLFVLGYAAETDLRNVRVSVLDQDRSRESRTMADAFHRSDVFVPGPPAASGEGLEDLLRKGRTDVGLWIPVGYADDLAAGRTARVSIAVDGSNSSVAGRAVGYAGEIVWEEARERMEARARAYPQAALQMHAVEPVSRFFYNPELRSRHYMIPGIVVLLVTIISALLTDLAVVREREIGTLEQLMVSPLTPGQLLAGKTIPVCGAGVSGSRDRLGRGGAVVPLAFRGIRGGPRAGLGALPARHSRRGAARVDRVQHAAAGDVHDVVLPRLRDHHERVLLSLSLIHI